YGWWSRYNYLTSAAMDSGLAISGLVIYFALQANNIDFPNWWGNPEDQYFDHCPLGGSNYWQTYPK
ncbi:OPT super, partial [Podila minutissima]